MSRVGKNAAWMFVGYLALVSGVTASMHAFDQQDHWAQAFQLIAAWAIVPLGLLAIFRRHPSLIRLAVSSIIAVQTLSAAAGLAQSFSGRDLLWGFAQHGRANGLAGHTNILGILSAVTILMCVGAANRLLLVAAAVNMGGLIVSGSLSAMIALVAGVAVFFVVRRTALWRILIATTALGTALYLAQVFSAQWTALRSPLHRVRQTTGQTDEISTLGIRAETFQYAWERIKQNPFWGAGLDDSSGATFDQVTLTHNLPIRAWFQGGIALAIAVIIVIGILSRLVVLAIGAATGGTEAATIVTLLVFSLTSATLSQPYFWLVCFGAWGSLTLRLEALGVRDGSRAESSQCISP